MQIVFRLLVLFGCAALTYEFCMNASVMFWARSNTTLKVTELTHTGWATTQIASDSSEAQKFRAIASRWRLWFPALADSVPRLFVTSNGIAIGTGGGEIFGGAGVFPIGDSGLLFPDGGTSFLTSSEESAIRAMHRHHIWGHH